MNNWKPSAYGNLTVLNRSTTKKKQQENVAVKFLISGSVAWVYELCVGHYLEFLKIQKQTSYHKSYAVLTSEMVAQKGLIGVLDG